MEKKGISIQTADGINLNAYLYSSEHSPKGIIILGPGLGVPQGYYDKYARFLSGENYHVILFDYRGIGEEHLNLASDKINLRNWGLEDMVAVIAFCQKEYPQLPRYAILHSIGGQVLGLVRNHQLLERVVTISTMGGYWKDEVFPVNLTTWFMWYIHIPLITWLFGYLPPSLTYRGTPIAKGVAREWAAWGKKANYISAFFGKTISQNYYPEIKLRMDAIWFTDDILATKRTLASVLDYYSNAKLKKWPLNPSDYGVGKIGHSGFYSSKCKGRLWQLPLEILEGKHD